MKKLVKLVLVGTLALALTSCGGTEETTAIEDNTTDVIETTEDDSNEVEETEEEEASVAATYTAEEATADDKGYKNVAIVDVDENGAITNVTIDALHEDGSTKREKVESGEYDMKAAGSEYSWTEQVELLSDYIVETQSTEIPLNEEGKTDAISGVSISIDSYLALVDEALASEAVITENEVPAEELIVLNEGTYVAEDDDFDSNGFKTKVTLTVDADGLVSDLLIEDFDENGVSKREKVENGEYDMSVAGSQYSWTEQIETFTNYVLENQTTDIAVDEEGKTDAISGVSISINEYIRLIDVALTEAEQ